MNKIRAFFIRTGESIEKFVFAIRRAVSPKAGGKQRPAEEEEDLFPQQGQTQRFSPIQPRKDGEETRLFRSLEDHAEEAHESEPLFMERVRKRPFVLSIFFTTLHFAVIGGVLLGLALLGAGIGVAKAYVETTPTIDRAQLTKSDRTSYIYDKDGQLITTFANLEYRDWVDIEQIPEMLQNAFVAVEDVRFYRHSGVDIKRLFSAALEILGNSNSSGGSTITQQLIKRKIVGTERNYKRKIQEGYLAIELEQEISKQDILEAYLNDIHLGGSNYGVKTAAKDYFGKELDQLTVRECAMLAGLTQNPYKYDPRKNMYKRAPEYWESTQRRTNTVLERMYEASFITLEQYQTALKEEVHIVEVSTQNQLYDMPYFVEYAIKDVVKHLLAQRGLPETNANLSAVENELRTSGYHIYTTVDRDMQNTVQETLATWDNYPQLKDPNAAHREETLSDGTVIETEYPQAAAVILDYHTGELRAIIGGRTSPTIRKGANRASQSYMEVGSSIKPLAVYGPALDAGASPATIIANLPQRIDGWGGEIGYPYIGEAKYIGPVTIRRGIVSSLNVVAARTLFERVQPEVGKKYLENLGANAAKINADGPGLALGTSGLTVIQMTAAYGAIAAGGEYKEPLSFTRVVDDNGNVILDANAVRDTHRVYKESTAYMLIDMLTDAVRGGTGTAAKISGMTVAGKTGTNSDYHSVYFAGMTPYYTSAVWIGHDYPQNVLKDKTTGGKYAAQLWQAYMEKLHENLPDKSIMDVSPAQLGLVKKTVCSVSGLLATDACYADSAGHVPVTDWFLEENAPTQTCDMHAAVTICNESGQIATPNCPSETVVSGAVVLVRPGTYYDQFPEEVLKQGIPNAVRTTLTLEQFNQSMAYSQGVCTLHTGTGQDISQLRSRAISLRQEILDVIASNILSAGDASILTQKADKLYTTINSSSTQSITYAILDAQQELARVRGVSTPEPTLTPPETIAPEPTP